MNCFDLISAYFKVQDFVRTNSSLLNEAVAADYDEELPFGVVPVLSFGDAWFAYIDTHLSAVQGVDKFCE